MLFKTGPDANSDELNTGIRWHKPGSYHTMAGPYEECHKKMGFDPVEIGMSKLKGVVLNDINGASKEGTLSYFWFCQLLIEHYSNIPYVSDALNAYTHLAQGEHKSVTQYLSRAKVLLEHIHNISKMCKIRGVSYDRLNLVRGPHSPHA